MAALLFWYLELSWNDTSAKAVNKQKTHPKQSILNSKIQHGRVLENSTRQG